MHLNPNYFSSGKYVTTKPGFDAISTLPTRPFLSFLQHVMLNSSGKTSKELMSGDSHVSVATIICLYACCLYEAANDASAL